MRSTQKANLKCPPKLRSWMGHRAHRTPLECVSKASASRLAVTEKLAPTRSLISVESVEAITRAARRCRDSLQSLCEYSAHYCCDNGSVIIKPD